MKFYLEDGFPEGAEDDGRTWRLEVGNTPLQEDSLIMMGGGAVVGVIPKGLPSLTVPKIDMRIITHDNQVRAVMVAESHEVKAIIERDIESLRASLNNNGLKVDQITVTTSEENHYFRGENLAGRHNSNGSGLGNSSSGASGDFPSAEGDSVADARVSYHDGLLDVIV